MYCFPLFAVYGAPLPPQSVGDVDYACVLELVMDYAGTILWTILWTKQNPRCTEKPCVPQCIDSMFGSVYLRCVLVVAGIAPCLFTPYTSI